MSCQYYERWQDEDNVWHQAGWYESEDGEFCVPSYGGGGNPNPNVIPNVLMTGGGVTAQGTNLDRILQTLLSGMAIIKGRPYVPTGIQPEAQPIIIQQGGGGVGGGAGGGGTALGKVEIWLKNNTGVALMAAAGVALFMMRPPPRSSARS